MSVEPCPNCYNSPHVIAVSSSLNLRQWWIYCSECSFTLEVVGPCKFVAIYLWNAHVEKFLLNYDGAPYCYGGHKGPSDCDCGPIAENN